ncbi:MAG: serine/threonine-protein kinase [Myxococcota bacterium]|nr:serine/threonine-protein kinase [Myxococcota bacterium]
MLDVPSGAAGAYEVVAHLKAGGMANLYLALRKGAAGFSRLVAVKVIHPDMAEDQQAVEMFVQEARITAQIAHPNVVHVEDLGEVSGTYFLVMEYIHGGTLAQLLNALSRNKRRLAPEVAVAIAARIAEGLHAAHEVTDASGRLLGLVHRDVSPQNILLSHKGHVKLIDFGVAKNAAVSHLSHTATLKGKIRYMSPEQARLEPVDRRSDVYSLGLVLWEMLTMRRPFRGKKIFEILEEVRSPRIPPPAQFARDVTPGLDAVVGRALSAHPDDRYADAKDFRRDLVRAFPRAAAIDSVHLADLLVSTLRDELEDVRGKFPDQVSQVLAAEQQRALAVLAARRADDPPTFPSIDGGQETMTKRYEMAAFQLDAIDEVSDLDLEADATLASGLDRTRPDTPASRREAPELLDEDDEATEIRTPTIVRVLEALQAREGPRLSDETGITNASAPRRPSSAQLPVVESPAVEGRPPPPLAARGREAQLVLAAVALVALGVLAAVVVWLVLR